MGYLFCYCVHKIKIWQLFPGPKSGIRQEPSVLPLQVQWCPFPTLSTFWLLEKPALQNICIEGSVIYSNNEKSPTCTLKYGFCRSGKKGEPKVFNWSELHFSEVTFYKIHILVETVNFLRNYIFTTLRGFIQGMVFFEEIR